MCVTNATIFAKEHFIKKSVYSYLALLMSPWNIQETWRCELSWACGNSFGAQNSIAFFDPRIRDSQILDCIARLHFWKHNFCARKNLAILNADKLQSFDGAPISYCGTLPTDNSERARGRERVCAMCVYVCVCMWLYVCTRASETPAVSCVDQHHCPALL